MAEPEWRRANRAVGTSSSTFIWHDPAASVFDDAAGDSAGMPGLFARIFQASRYRDEPARLDQL